MTFEAWLTRTELARLYGVSERTVARWIVEGCPSQTWGARFRRFRLSEVERWLTQRSTEAA